MSEVEMNRLILIGNGFDLAHGLETSFYNFINYCVFEMSKFIIIKHEDTIESFSIEEYTIESFLIDNDIVHSESIKGCCKLIIKTYEDLLICKKKITEEVPDYYLKKYSEKLDNYLNCKQNEYNSNINYLEKCEILFDKEYWKKTKDFINDIKGSTSEIDYTQFVDKLFKNKLFKIILNKCKADKNWGGIEHDFYQTLLNVKKFYKGENIPDEIDKIDILNKEFENIIDCFGHYMKTVVSKQKTENLSKIADHLKQAVKKCELSTQFRDRIGQQPIVIKEHMFLNFNYTNTVEKYIAQSSVNVEEKHVQIHGRLEDSASGIIFGYGDELDSSYKELEDKNDNRYLKYSKSLHYLYKNNYQKLLDFLEQNKYQVYIWGHSCATSDRVLLQTIFEHENCVSIKPFYYQDTKGNDNFADLCANISRSFTDKKKFRDLVVNKEYCEPLT